MTKMTIQVDVQIPMVPNFLRVKGQDAPISIGEFKDEHLIAIAEQWKIQLLKRAEIIRNNKKST